MQAGPPPLTEALAAADLAKAEGFLQEFDNEPDIHRWGHWNWLFHKALYAPANQRRTLASKEVAKKSMPHTIPAVMTIDESFDVGVDTRTSVDDKDYQPPFRFTGKLDKLTIRLEPPK